MDHDVNEKKTEAKWKDGANQMKLPHMEDTCVSILKEFISFREFIEKL